MSKDAEKYGEEAQPLRWRVKRQYHPFGDGEK
jgi:hypothetical protein